MEDISSHNFFSFQSRLGGWSGCGMGGRGISTEAGFIEGLSHPTDVLSTDIAR